MEETRNLHVYTNEDGKVAVIIFETKNSKGKKIYEMSIWDRDHDEYRKGQWLTGCELVFEQCGMIKDMENDHGFRFFYLRKELDGTTRRFGIECIPPYFSELTIYGPHECDIPAPRFTSDYIVLGEGPLMDKFKNDRFRNVPPPIGYFSTIREEDETNDSDIVFE